MAARFGIAQFIANSMTKQSTSRTEQGGGHYSALDSMRGIAAMAVVFYHLAQVPVLENGQRTVVFGLLRPLFCGHEAVVLFFVLSGFVLSLSFWKWRRLDYRGYLIRRFARIYLPYLAALAFAVAGAARFGSSPLPLSRWFAATWNHPVLLRDVLMHVAFIGQYEYAQFNTAFWSLIVEMRVSLVFPLVCIALARLSYRQSLGVALGCSGLSLVLTKAWPAYGDGWAKYFDTFHWLAFFIIGALLARSVVGGSLPAISRRMRVPLLIAALVLYWYGYVFYQIYKTPIGKVAGEWACAIGAVTLIGLAIQMGPLRDWLETSLPSYLGKISYSVYLIHGTVLFGLMHLSYGKIPFYLIAGVYVAVTVGLADLSYRFIEVPSIRFGKRVSGMALMRRPVRGSMAPQSGTGVEPVAD